MPDLEALRDEYYSRALDLTRAGGGLWRKMRGLLTTLFNDVSKEVANDEQLNSERRTVRSRRARSMMNDVAAMLGKGYDEIAEEMKSDMVELGDAEQIWLEEVGAKHIGVALTPVLNLEDLRTLAEEFIVAGVPIEEWWNKQNDNAQSRLRRVVANAVVRGQNPRETARLIRGKPTGRRFGYKTKDGKQRFEVEFEGGILGITTRQAEAIARTAQAGIAAATRRRAYLESADIIRGLQQLSTLDSRTTKICAAYDGEAWLFELEDFEGTGIEPPPRLVEALPQPTTGALEPAPPPAIDEKNPATMRGEEFLTRKDYDSAVARAGREPFPVHTWRVDEFGVIEELRELPIYALDPVVEGGFEAAGVANPNAVDDLMSEMYSGARPPAIVVEELEPGAFRVLEGYEHVAAALELGRENVEAWVNPSYQPGSPERAPMTHELAVKSSLDRGGNVPDDVLSEFETLVAMIAEGGGEEPS